MFEALTNAQAISAAIAAGSAILAAVVSSILTARAIRKNEFEKERREVVRRTLAATNFVVNEIFLSVGLVEVGIQGIIRTKPDKEKISNKQAAAIAKSLCQYHVHSYISFMQDYSYLPPEMSYTTIAFFHSARALDESVREIIFETPQETIEHLRGLLKHAFIVCYSGYEALLKIANFEKNATLSTFCKKKLAMMKSQIEKENGILPDADFLKQFFENHAKLFSYTQHHK